MTDIYSQIVFIIGTPQNDVQATIVYFVACIVGLLIVFLVPYSMKLIASSGRH